MSAVLAEILAWGGALAGIYFTVALVVAFAQAHLGAVTGRAGVMAEMHERVILIVICFAVAASAAALGQQVAQPVGGGAQDAGAAVTLWRSLAEFVVRAVILSVGASLAVGFASGVLGAQLSVLTGRPGTLAVLAGRLVAVVVTGVLTLLAVRLAGLVIGLAG